MHLLYLDESGNENDPADRYFVLAGLAVFERQTYFVSRDVDAVQDKHFQNHQPIPFHASEIRSGRNLWRKELPEKRSEVLRDLGAVIAGRAGKGCTLFAAAVEKDRDRWGEAAVERATEDVCRRFDIFLQRQYHENDDPQRGLIVFSEGRFDSRAKLWVRGFRDRGTRWGAIKNLADIPYFAPMHESRLLQLADLIAHAVWLLYERRDPTLIRALLSAFDVRDGVLHGLAHVRSDPALACDCPACNSRRRPHELGPWVI